MMYTTSQKYTNMVVGDIEYIQPFKVVNVVLFLLLLLIDVFVSTSAYPLLLVDKRFVHIYLIVNWNL